MLAASVLAACLLASAGSAAGPRAIPVCAAAGPYWPTMTLALDGPSAWVACKEQSRLVRVDTRTGRTLRSLRLTAPVIAVATGYGSVWAVDTSSTLYRIRGGKVAKRIPLFARAAYNVWLGGGSVWVADDQGAEVIRVSPASNKVVAHVAVGDGPASMAFAPGRAWVMSHRDRTLQRIALDTNAVTRLATLGGDDAAPERMVYAQGSLWITGRGADLLRVDPETGAVQSTTEIGASGIDLVAGGGELWVPARNATVDQTGFPTMSALRIVSPAGSALDFFTPSGRFDVHGLAVGQGSVWLADNTRGRLYSFPLVCGNLARLDALGRAPAPKPEEAAAASAAAGAVAPAAIRRDAATLAGYYRAVASGGLPARDAAAVAATRLGRWSAGACPRAYDVL